MKFCIDIFSKSIKLLPSLTYNYKTRQLDLVIQMLYMQMCSSFSDPAIFNAIDRGGGIFHR